MFENTTELIYLATRNGVAKNGNPYQVLVVGNPAKYENYEFFIGDNVKVPFLQTNDKVLVTVELSRRNYNLVPTLVDVAKAVLVED